MLDFKGVSTVNLPAIKKPTGFTDPEVTPVTGGKLWRWDNEVEVDRETVYDPDRKTTLENILNDEIVGLNVKCEELAQQLENSTNSVEAYAELLNVGSNLDEDDPSSDFYVNVDDKFVCPLIIWAKVTEGGGE